MVTNSNAKFRKPQAIDVADSNLALVGSDLDKKVRIAAAQDEPAWKNAGKAITKATGFASAGIQIWRIEKFHVVAWPLDKYGQFYTGDSYIVLYTYKRGDTEKLLYNVHYWIGNESTQDEYGTAAYKVVELDALLMDLPVQYREAQGSESALFLSYFSKLIILNGGIDSGFRHVKREDYKPRLLHIKHPVAKPTARATLKRGMGVYTLEVPVDAESLNSGDCFIYDAGHNLYQFNGKTSSGIERIRAAQMARAIDDERGGVPEVHVFEEGDGSDYENTFWEALGGKKAIAAHTDKNVGETREMRLFRLSDKSGNMTFKQEKNVSVSKKLDSNDVFIFDSGQTVYVWIGEGASTAERMKGMTFAIQYIKDNSLSESTHCVRIPQNAIHPEFTQLLNEFFV